ncbi:putative ammonium permease ATO2 [Sugiyamaella lignohabitans]|uniref:Putative ammonium permease ATO2 n=1 Tax=Sugiyamaella lignohabitans TaxID=796027 RepID=A0A161HWU2_9ASCO|nr:putative ammonium permease ATO2 [Sugiyamaella lignohabitans]ANB13223.1 putative ammonium permease ATO2 [Sugiyamaella lignohabitans]
MTTDIEQTAGADKYSTNLYENQPPVISRIQTSGTDNEYIHIGNTIVRKDELVEAFAGDLNPALHTLPSRKLANPTPLGLSAFGLTTFVLSLINLGTRGVHTQNILIGVTLFYGGAIQVIAGLFEFVLENTFGATALTSFGAFWITFGAILTPSFGIISGYEDPTELDRALGLYLLSWFIFVTMMTFLTIRSTVPFFVLFFTTDMAFLTLGIGHLLSSSKCIKAGGWFGVVASFLAWYVAFAGLATKENCYIQIKPWFMPGAHRLK